MFCVLRAFCLVRTGTLLVLAGAGPSRAQPVRKVAFEQDVVYGRVHGAGLLADIAYPDGKGPFPAMT